MAIDYNDARFQNIENEKNSEINQTTNTYNEMINNSDSFYQSQIDASKDWANKQQEIQQANTDFAIEKIEQQKEQAKQDYTREQKAAYADYAKASNKYGVAAEQQATQGLQNSGYSESVQNSMYNTYQNRYMTARDTFNRAILNYDNSIKEAQLANNSALATIAYEALQKQLELGLQGFQYKNTLVLQKQQSLNEMNDRYYNRYQDVVAQINTENALAEQIRQYNETMAFQREQAAQEQANWERQYALSLSKSSGGSSRSPDNSSISLTDISNDENTIGADNGENYDKALSMAKLMYRSALKNKTQAAEATLATYVADDKITVNEAGRIMKQIGK